MSKGPEKQKEGGERTGEIKKVENRAPGTPHAKSKGHEPLPGSCFSWGCKTRATRFNFCEEHYDHFKFGLVKKTGEPVPDYEKKFEHYTAHRKKSAGSMKKAG